MFDLAILGSGFSGSLLAMAARRIGLRVLLIERGAHPRFALGESTSPLTNLLLEELAREYDLPRLLPLTEYGRWIRTYPEVAVGLKRGFTYYHHRTGEPFAPDPDHQRHLLVAASPNDEVADTHWYRADFDHFLVREAQALGADYTDETQIASIQRHGDTAMLAGEQHGKPVRYKARFVVDATGARGALSRLLGLPERPFAHLPKTQGLFSHFTGVARFAPLAGTDGQVPPYPPDDSALHHLFEGGWMWVLRFGNGITSAGIAVEDWLAEALNLGDSDAGWQRFLDCFPSIRTQFEAAQPVVPFIHARRLPYRYGKIVGEGWALLPSAAAFIDPLFSTGFPLTLLGLHRLARLLRDAWGTSAWEAGLREYAAHTEREAETAALLVAGHYRAFTSPSDFAALSMLYFVAVSYAEMARRLGRAHLAPGFLLCDRMEFATSFRRHLARALRGEPIRPEAIAHELSPFNIAGLCDPRKRNWYGVDLQDVLRSSSKLAARPQEVAALFARMGW